MSDITDMLYSLIDKRIINSIYPMEIRFFKLDSQNFPCKFALWMSAMRGTQQQVVSLAFCIRFYWQENYEF